MAVSRRNRYFRSLKGLNAQGFISPASTNYTAATTFALFVQGVGAGTIANGVVGIFNAATNAIQTVALVAGTKYFIAQAVDGQIKKSVIFTAGTGNMEIRRTAYTAPVLQQVIVGFNGTSGVLGTIIPTSGSLTMGIQVRDLSPATQPFPVQEGEVRVTNTAATEYDIVASIVSNLSNIPDYEGNTDAAFVRVGLISNGTKTAIATVTATVIEGSPQIVYAGGVHTLVVGDILQVTLNGADRVYKVVSVPSTTIAVLDRPWADTGGTTAAGGTAKVTVQTEYGIVITAFVHDTAFSVTRTGTLLTNNATVTEVTAWKQGSGAAWQVAALERETQVFSGYSSANAAFPDDMGKPQNFVSETEATTFDVWFLKYKNETPSMAYMNENAVHFGYILLAAPSSGTTAQDEFNTIFGT